MKKNNKPAKTKSNESSILDQPLFYNLEFTIPNNLYPSSSLSFNKFTEQEEFDVNERFKMHWEAASIPSFNYELASITDLDYSTFFKMNNSYNDYRNQFKSRNVLQTIFNSNSDVKFYKKTNLPFSTDEVPSDLPKMKTSSEYCQSLSEEESRESTANIVGFFKVLARWDNIEKE